MSSSNTLQTEPKPGTWTKIVRAPLDDPNYTSLPVLHWSDTPEHYLQTITARRFYSWSREGLEQYREWQFSDESRKFVARTQHHELKDAPPRVLRADNPYREFDYVQLVGMYNKLGKPVPQWVRMTSTYGERLLALQERLSSKFSLENLEMEYQEPSSLMSQEDMKKEISFRLDSARTRLSEWGWSNRSDIAQQDTGDKSSETSRAAILENLRHLSAFLSVLTGETGDGSNGSNGSKDP